MRGWSSPAAGLIVAVLAAALLAALSDVPYDAGSSDQALVRLSWRVRGERVEECRRLAREELAARPAHMRQAEVCQGRVLPYRLTVALNGETVVDRLVHAAGAREDRPIYVFQEIAVRPGDYDLSVAFERQGGGVDQAATPAALRLASAVSLRSREVALIGYDAGRRVLLLRRPE